MSRIENDRDWYTCGKPRRMVNFVLSNVRENDADDRRMRLLAVAVVRLFRSLLDSGPPNDEILRVAEVYADHPPERPWDAWEELAGRTDSERIKEACMIQDRDAALVACSMRGDSWSGGDMAVVVRDVFDTPFRQWVETDQEKGKPSVRDFVHHDLRPFDIFRQHWRTPLVTEIARDAYEKHDWGTLPILADALQDAGCDAERLLRHLRGFVPCFHGLAAEKSGGFWCPDCGGTDGESEGWVRQTPCHARGCWALDLVLGESR